jgi:hypothetical protein
MLKKSLIILIFSLISIPKVYSHDFTHVAGSPFYWEENKKNPYGFKVLFGLNYSYENGSLNREHIEGAALNIVKDLDYTKSQFTLDMGFEAGIKGVSLYLHLPVILSSQETFKFQDGNRYVGYTGQTDCETRNPGAEYKCNPDGVNSLNSTTVMDNISAGLFTSDASVISTTPGVAGKRTLFNGVNRAGLDQLHLGLKFNIPVFNQYEDKTKPYWIIGFDVGLPVGSVKDFQRTSTDGAPICTGGTVCSDNTTQRPLLNSAVGRGIYDVTFFTTMSKRLGMFDTFFKLYATLPFGYTSDSLYADKYNFDDDGYGMKPLKAPIRGGILFGTDINMYQDLKKKIRVNFNIQGILLGIFEGHDYSEGYELFAGSPALNTDPYINSLTTFNNIQYFPGLTTVENHAIMGAKMGITMRYSRYFYLEAMYGLSHKTEHFITYTDAGDDGSDANNTVQLNTTERNPYYRTLIDEVGQRYRIQETMIHTFMLSLRVIY